MRLLFYIESAEWTGSVRAFAAAARGLAERGHGVTVACRPGSAVERRLEFGAYEVLPLAGDLPAPLLALRLHRVFVERFVQVSFVHTDREHLVTAIASRLAERAVVLRRVPSGMALRVRAAGRTALRTAISGFLFSTEEELRRSPLPRTTRLAPSVAPLGVNPQLYDAIRPASRASIGAPGGTRLLVCVYDGTSRARAATVLRVVALLAPRHPELRLALVGPGSDDEDLRMHAAALRVTRRVRFLGERDDHLSVLAVADLGWVVADGDNAMFALLDLLASRVPVLAERGTMAQQLVPDGIAGILLPPGEAADTAAVIARLLAHDDRRAAMGGAGRARVSRDHSERLMIDGFEHAAAAASDRTQW